VSTLSEKYDIHEKIHSANDITVYYGEIKGIQGFRRPIAIQRHHNLSEPEILTLAKDANILGMLNHANIIQVLDLGNWDNDWAVVTEQVRGCTLSEFVHWHLRDVGPIPDDLIAYVLYEVIRGIEYAHRQHPPSLATHILHRNLSPDNVLIGVQGNIKIQGFSTRIQIDAQSPFHSPDTLCDARTDVWGLGALLHTMLVGLESSDPLATQTSAPNTALERLVQQAVHPNPDKRFQSVAALKEALLDQYGKIALDAGISMQQKISQMKGEPFAVLGDDATYVSRTLASSEIPGLRQTKSTVKQTVKIELAPTNPGTPESIVRPTFPPSAPATPSAPLQSPWVFLLSGLALGVILGIFGSTTIYQTADTSEVHWIFPQGHQIKVGEDTITESGHHSILPANTPTKVTWILSEQVQKELTIQLQPGESRWINLESP
jgi:serine/threonine-protein kinase